MFGGQLIRLEDGMNDGRYEIRAELPGIDPAKDVDVTARDGVLTIRAQRGENRKSNGRSEFTYGSFVRSVTLPQGSNEREESRCMRWCWPSDLCVASPRALDEEHCEAR